MPMTLNDLIEEMFPDAIGEERARFRNATRVLAQKGAIVPVEDVSGSGRHRRYDPIWVPLARTLLLLKVHYKLHTDILVEIGQFLWNNRDMVEHCPDPVVIYGDFYEPDQDAFEMGFRLISSAERETIFYPVPEAADQSYAKHCIAVAIDVSSQQQNQSGEKI